jgi:hypothetical protein
VVPALFFLTQTYHLNISGPSSRPGSHAGRYGGVGELSLFAPPPLISPYFLRRYTQTYEKIEIE